MITTNSGLEPELLEKAANWGSKHRLEVADIMVRWADQLRRSVLDLNTVRIPKAKTNRASKPVHN